MRHEGESFADALSQSAEFLVVVPPFGGIDRPSLGASIIADIARAEGLTAQVFYANLDFASVLGSELYQELCHTPTGLLIGEQIFSAGWVSRGPNPLGAPVLPSYAAVLDETDAVLRKLIPGEPEPLKYLQDVASRWAEEMGHRLARTRSRMIGFTSVYEQTLASLTLIRHVKSTSPEKILILGGANCDGELANGIRSVASGVDVIFSGESEESFRNYVRDSHSTAPGSRESPHIIRSTGPKRDLDEIPLPAYEDYFEQFSAALVGTEFGDLLERRIWIPYETSRGCWWGQKHHCTFCGLNAEGMVFREKSVSRVLADLDAIEARYGRDRVLMVDNIMPYRYFTTLLPELASRESKFHIFYEQKANLSFHRMKLLWDAGVRRIQPGIEALSSPLLAHMRKGVTVRQNIQCLRYARAVGMDVTWNLLLDFPGDEVGWYETTAGIIPHLAHLQPPSGCSPLSIDRFSPYFERPAQFGIHAVRPIPAYSLAFGDVNSLPQIAYHFQGEYTSAARGFPAVAAQLSECVDAWREAWSSTAKPLLQVMQLGDDRFLLIDTRPGAAVNAQVLDRAHAEVVLHIPKGTEEALWEWAREGNYAIEVDGERVPLAVASRACMEEFPVP
ncbi:RiPP maturation radical SAM C-methyltransferase [Actinocorallia sp. API 0066]|uniref:RiPP maturation radical SAM C-methyltransferase n=1 Tax=Actinocorallia sp. API 0066 TaxID=2896846 RepID=UPI001E5E3809|nr:RiPP maturation radical SAM C-methyltransferase [Actinocorallia sp. API 0066]MCD0449353.1 RiPP maturation radical SAM C-methyltransferase [Actinocorallia sp. API 0066]